MTAKSAKFLIILIAFLTPNLYSNTIYKMSVDDIEVLSSNKIQACVYIENVEEEFVLTSYQCALSINQSIDLSSLQLEYVEGSSDLLNEPNLFVGVDNIDGPTELTFVSYIGNDIISSKKLVGIFTLEGNININDINLLDIQWDFEGTISTIITGDNFVNITNPLSHESIFPSDGETQEAQKLFVVNVEASSTTDTNTSAIGTIDGKGHDDGDIDARWATQPMPASLMFDLGEEKLISRTRFSFFYFDEGRIYQYSVRISKDMINWTEVLSDVSSKEEEWSEESFTPTEGRYLEIEVHSSTNNPGQWANIWEAEIYGVGTVNSIEDQQEDDEIAEIEDEIPSEYGISQNYPNPFNPSTKVEVMMKDNGRAKLDVYNLLGEKVLEVIDGELRAGVHRVNIDGSKLASGIYIYQLIVNNQVALSKKMQLMK